MLSACLRYYHVYVLRHMLILSYDIKQGTITINGKKETTEQKEQASVTETNIQETGSREATIDESTKEKTSTKKDSRKAYVWIALGLLCAVLLIGAGIYLARQK